MNFLKLIILSIAFLGFCFNAISQVYPPFKSLDKISFIEQKACLNRSNNRQIENIVENYNIKYHRFNLIIDPNVRYISGSVTTYFLITQDNSTQITFEFSDTLYIDSVIFNSTNKPFTNVNDILTIDLQTTLNANNFDSVSIFYHGVPRYDGNSFGHEFHDTLNPTPIIWTLSEPYGAKEWWPCKQDLNDKVDSIDVYITTPSQFRAASNGILISETNVGLNKTYHWKHKYPIATYLIAFAVTNYAVFSDYVPMSGIDSLEVLNYVYPEDSSKWFADDKIILDVMQLLNFKLIDYPFKNEKYGHAQFGWVGGMEHQTMSFMYDLNFYLLSHEVCHQWFGNYITCGSWQDIWLNEGFATYFGGAIPYENLFNGYYWPYWKSDLIDRITAQPNGSVFCPDTTDVSRVFNSRLSYLKGSYLLHMIRWEIGDSAFFASIKNYLTDTSLAHNYSRTQNIKNHFEIVADTSLSEFFNDWFYGEGFPYYSVLWNQSSDSLVNLSIEQTQSDTSVSFFEMKLPLQFWGNSNDTIAIFKHSFNGQSFSFKAPFMVDSIVFDPEMWILTKDPLIENIREISEKNDKLLIYPNPTRDEIFIILPDNLKVNKIKIIDINGRSVLDKISISNKENICIADINSGCYFIIIETDLGRINRKFIKQ